MKKLVLLTLMLFAFPTLATEQTVVLAVENMTCAVCPITVKKSLQKVDGVEVVKVSFDDKEARVTFDDEKTTVTALITATTNAGFPSMAKE